MKVSLTTYPVDVKASHHKDSSKTSGSPVPVPAPVIDRFTCSTDTIVVTHSSILGGASSSYSSSTVSIPITTSSPTSSPISKEDCGIEVDPRILSAFSTYRGIMNPKEFNAMVLSLSSCKRLSGLITEGEILPGDLYTLYTSAKSYGESVELCVGKVDSALERGHSFEYIMTKCRSSNYGVLDYMAKDPTEVFAGRNKQNSLRVWDMMWAKDFGVNFKAIQKKDLSDSFHNASVYGGISMDEFS